jgi:hypothetical protein
LLISKAFYRCLAHYYITKLPYLKNFIHNFENFWCFLFKKNSLCLKIYSTPTKSLLPTQILRIYMCRIFSSNFTSPTHKSDVNHSHKFKIHRQQFNLKPTIFKTSFLSSQPKRFTGQLLYSNKHAFHFTTLVFRLFIKIIWDHQFNQTSHLVPSNHRQQTSQFAIQAENLLPFSIPPFQKHRKNIFQG